MTTRLAIAAVVSVAAGVAGFFLGEGSPAPPPDKDTGGAQRQSAGNPEPGALAALAAPRELTELRPEIAAAVEAGLAAARDNPFAALAAVLEIEDESVRAEAGFELIGRLSAADLRSLITGVAAFGEDSPEGEMFGELFEDDILTLMAMFDRSAHLDAAAVAEFARSPFPADAATDYFETSLAMRGLSLAFLAQGDPQRAFEIVGEMRRNGMLEKVPNGMGSAIIDMFLGMGLAAADPVLALRTMLEHGIRLDADGGVAILKLAGTRAEQMLVDVMAFPAGNQRQSMLASLYRSWGAFDLEAGIASAESMPEGTGREALIAETIHGASGTDPLAAAEALVNLPEGKQRELITQQILSRWSQQDPVGALEWSREHLDDQAFSSRLREVSDQLTVADGVKFVEALAPDARADFFASAALGGIHFILRMVREDSVGALAWLSENGGIDPSGQLGMVFGIAAAEGDFQKAIAAATTLPAGEFRDDFIRSVAGEAGRAGEAVISWARQQGELAHTKALQGWSHEDPLAAAEYARSQSTDLVAAVVGVWSTQDPAAAYHWTVGQHQGDPQAIAAVLGDSRVLEFWGEADPAAAAEAISEFPGDLGHEQLSQIIDQWAGWEPRGASTFITEQLGNGPARDAAVVALVSRIRKENPEEALVWAESISDESARAAAVETLQPQE